MGLPGLGAVWASSARSSFVPGIHRLLSVLPTEALPLRRCVCWMGLINKYHMRNCSLFLDWSWEKNKIIGSSCDSLSCSHPTVSPAVPTVAVLLCLWGRARNPHWPGWPIYGAVSSWGFSPGLVLCMPRDGTVSPRAVGPVLCFPTRPGPLSS